MPDIISSSDEEGDHNVLNLFLDVVAPGHASGKFLRRRGTCEHSSELSSVDGFPVPGCQLLGSLRTAGRWEMVC